MSFIHTVQTPHTYNNTHTVTHAHIYTHKHTVTHRYTLSRAYTRTLNVMHLFGAYLIIELLSSLSYNLHSTECTKVSDWFTKDCVVLMAFKLIKTIIVQYGKYSVFELHGRTEVMSDCHYRLRKSGGVQLKDTVLFSLEF